MADEVIYVYAVGDSDLAESEVVDIRAVDETPVRIIVEGPVAAVVSAVDAEGYSAESLRQNLESLPWLERTARAHHTVVADLARRRPVAPVRLATVFVNEDNVRELLRTRAPEFVEALDRIRGRCEWAVKGFLVVADPAAVSAGPSAGLGPGRSYLERRRADRQDRDQQRRQAAADAEIVHRRLAGLALASRRYPPQDRRLTGYRDEMLLNAAYLLPEGEHVELRRVVHEGQSPHLRIELAGPWAPYSFATLESDR